MKNKIFRFFSSDIKIKVCGKNVDNFIKRLIRNRICIKKVIPISYKEVDLIIDYNDLNSIIKFKTIYDIKIICYYGKLRIIKYIKKNIFILSFLIVGLFIIYFLSNIIFSIDVIHSNSNIVKLVEDELYNNGIKKFSFVKSYDEIEEIKNNILDNNKDSLEWLEIIRNGTKYIVRVEDRILNNVTNDENDFEIVAKKNAIIKEIIFESGEKIKDINSYVRKDETVISPYITLPDNSKKLVKARGNVIGEVWYTVDIMYPYYYNETLYTGKKKKVISFNYLNKKFSLFDFDKYKNFNKDTKIIFKNIFLPISLEYEYQYETNIINEVYTYDTAREKAIELAKKKLMDKYDSIKEINKVIIIFENDNVSGISLNLFISCNEDITEYKNISLEENIDVIN